MNFFWDGTPLSWMRYTTLASFRKFNPAWDIHLYRPSVPCHTPRWRTPELDDREYAGRDYMADVDSLGVERKEWKPPLSQLAPAHASDVFQWDILGTIGGWYSDMDVLFTSPMDHAVGIFGNTDAVFCLETGGIAIGFFGAAPQSPVFQSIYREAVRHNQAGSYQCSGVEAVYRAAGTWPPKPNVSIGGYHAMDAFRTKHPGLAIADIPEHAIYHYDWQSFVRLYDADETIPTETCIGLHWFGGSPVSQKWNNLLTADNYTNYKMTFTTYAKRVLQ